MLNAKQIENMENLKNKLTEGELKVLMALIKSSWAYGGDFTYADEVEIEYNSKELGGYISQLTQKQVILVMLQLHHHQPHLKFLYKFVQVEVEMVGQIKDIFLLYIEILHILVQVMELELMSYIIVLDQETIP